jgi:uncharacterized protein YjbI with pentapeptide repeats
MPCACESAHNFPCQFPAETAFFDFDGRQWCRFHLPLQDAGGNKSAKGRGEEGWEEGGEEWEDFKDAIYHRIRMPKDGILIKEACADLKGVAFPDKFSFSKFFTAPRVIGTNFAKSVFGNGISFEEATFAGKVSFEGATFGNEINFFRTRIESDVNFTHTIFYGKVRFDEAQFVGTSDFACAIFYDRCDFINTMFVLDANFIVVTFHREVSFDRASFRENVNFSKAKFNGTANFHDIKFYNNEHKKNSVNFTEATFESSVNFNVVEFPYESAFINVNFKGTSYFDRSKFVGITEFNKTFFEKSVRFDNSILNGKANFSEVRFGGEVNFSIQDTRNAELKFQEVKFSNSIFSGPAFFRNRNFTANANFNGALFQDLTEFHGCTFHPAMSFHQTKFQKTKGVDDDATEKLERSYRTLKLHMEDLRARNEEADFFALEMECRRQRGSVHWTERLAATAYKYFSDYGRSIARPLNWLLGVTMFFWISFWLINSFSDGKSIGDILLVIKGGGDGLLSILGFTLEQMFRPFYIWSEHTSPTAQSLLKKHSLLIPFLASLQSLFTIGLLTLFLLALRRRFKMD